eukprot:TRINITY_DN7267_c0_g1_i1.p1 TRINITY_DN7267_c0_g1~~TRINITY_DN7267_c0_g1_i1.p1  ORF type:complete len:253 (+),score=42.82 TRINITY_DN7267_c0_g1_i1:121-879(+)
MSKVPDFIDPSEIPMKFFNEISKPENERDNDKLLTYCEIVDPQYIDIKEERGYEDTMLLSSVKHDRLDLVKILLEKNADINAVDKFKNSVLMRAYFSGKTQDVGEYLLENYLEDIDFTLRNTVNNDILLITTHALNKRSEKLKTLANYPRISFDVNNDYDNVLTYIVSFQGSLNDVVDSLKIILSREEVDVNYRKANDDKNAISILINKYFDDWKEMCKLITQHPTFDESTLTFDEIKFLNDNKILEKKQED